MAFTPESLTADRLTQLQRIAGNAAVQRMVQEEPDATGAPGGGIAVAERQATPVQLGLFEMGYLSGNVEGSLEHLESSLPAAGPDAGVSVGEFGHTLKAKSVELSASLLKMELPWDGINAWLNLGDHVKCSASLAAFKLTADSSYKDLKGVEDLGLSLGEFEVVMAGVFDHLTMQALWGVKYFGGTQLGRALAKKNMAFKGSIKLAIAVPAEDAVRLAHIAARHRQLLAMSYQNAVWIRRVKAAKAAQKELLAAWKGASSFERMSLSARLAENRSTLKVLGTNVAKNKKLARSILGEAVKLAKGLGGVLKATLGKFIPVLNAYFLVTDTIKAVEVIYGLVTGKGYSFSLSGEDGGSGEGDDPDAGSAAEGTGLDGESADEGASSPGQNPELAGLED